MYLVYESTEKNRARGSTIVYESTFLLQLILV